VVKREDSQKEGEEGGHISNQKKLRNTNAVLPFAEEKTLAFVSFVYQTPNGRKGSLCSCNPTWAATHTIEGKLSGQHLP